jgi:hypothetical protein
VCWDNAVAESFLAALKNDLHHRHTWPTRNHARTAVAESIEALTHQQQQPTTAA